jgi:hypothetical protein
VKHGLVGTSEWIIEEFMGTFLIMAGILCWFVSVALTYSLIKRQASDKIKHSFLSAIKLNLKASDRFDRVASFIQLTSLYLVLAGFILTIAENSFLIGKNSDTAVFLLFLPILILAFFLNRNK